jgi:phage gp36-like protein
MEQIVGTDAFLRAADRDGDGQPDSAAVDAALKEASSRADTYITKWLPLTTVPDALRNAVIRIAHYELTGETGNEEARKRYEDALQWLRDVGRGRAFLGVETSPPKTDGAPDFHTKSRRRTTGLGEVL